MIKRISAVLLMLALAVGLQLEGAGRVDAGQARRRISFYVFDELNIENIEAEIAFGRRLAARILGNYKLVEDDNLHRYVAMVAKAVSLYSGRPELKYHVGILNSTEINAFAAPGGYIFITHAALMAMDNEAQLAAVIGHEIAHIQERHILKELKFKGTEKSMLAGIGNLVGGASGTVRVVLDQALDEAAEVLFKRGYKKDDEIEADRLGILMASVAGYSPVALKVFLSKVHGFEPQETINEDSEHPLHELRIAKIDETLNENGLLSVQQVNIKERFHDTVRSKGVEAK